MSGRATSRRANGLQFPRLGQQVQPVIPAITIATAVKVNNFFITRLPLERVVQGETVGVLNSTPRIDVGQMPRGSFFNGLSKLCNSRTWKKCYILFNAS